MFIFLKLSYQNQISDIILSRVLWNCKWFPALGMIRENTFFLYIFKRVHCWLPEGIWPHIVQAVRRVGLYDLLSIPLSGEISSSIHPPTHPFILKRTPVQFGQPKPDLAGNMPSLQVSTQREREQENMFRKFSRVSCSALSLTAAAHKILNKFWHPASSSLASSLDLICFFSLFMCAKQDKIKRW